MADDKDFGPTTCNLQKEYKLLNHQTRIHVKQRLIREIKHHWVDGTNESLTTAILSDNIVPSLRGLLVLLNGGAVHYKGNVAKTALLAPRTKHMSDDIYHEIIDLLESSGTPMSMLWSDFVELAK